MVVNHSNTDPEVLGMYPAESRATFFLHKSNRYYCGPVARPGYCPLRVPIMLARTNAQRLLRLKNLVVSAQPITQKFGCAKRLVNRF